MAQIDELWRWLYGGKPASDNRMADAKALQQSDESMALMLSDMKAKREGRYVERAIPSGNAVLRYRDGD